MNFNEFNYQRSDIASVQQLAQKTIKTIQEATTFQQANEAFISFNQAMKEVSTMMTLCSIRHSINTQDEFYEKETEFWDENLPFIQQVMTDFNNAILDSAYLDDFKATYPQTYFLLAENARKCFNETIIEDLQEENKLMTKYSKLIASAKLDFDGKTLTLAQLGPYLQSTDRSVRKAASDVNWSFFQQHEQELDEIYDQMVKVRTTMAKKLGFSTYTELAYVRMNRFDYNQDMVANYRRQILEEVVPVVGKLQQRQAKRLGLDELKYYDHSIKFLDGNATPVGSAEDILENGREMYHELSPETGEFIDLMIDGQLMDVLAKPGKRSGGYMTFLPSYKVPFIFSNFNGTSGDIDVLTHEAGHAFQGYQSRNISLDDCVMPTMESCEIHSMSMEFLTWPYMERFFKDKADKYRFSHLVESLSFLPYGVLVDHFQHEIYNHPELTPEERKAVWKKLDQQYRPTLDFEDNDFANKGTWWYKQGHIFSSPFYYIDYTLAQVCAFQFWKRKFIDKDPQTWNDYLHICQIGGTATFLDIVKQANLTSPFEDGCLKSVVSEIDKYLSAIDDSKL